MPVVNTKKWLLDSINNPIEVTEKLLPYYKDIKAKSLYHYLVQCGMYVNDMYAEKAVEQLINEDVWGTVETIFEKYKKIWNGPDVPVFIFPHRKNGLFSKAHNKSGLAYPDKLLLFLSPSIGKNEMEALLIHEYHHVCRLKKQKKQMTEFTIMDSIILEGCAEYMVRELKGIKYLAPWTTQYPEDVLKRCYEDFFKNSMDTNNKELLHNQLLFGMGRYPYMIGYCLGYYLITLYSQIDSFSLEETFTVKPAEVIEQFNNMA